MERFSIDPQLAAEVCDRLGVEIPGDLAGVASLYRAWSARIPFDPVAKAAALAEDRVPPGADARAFCEAWLEHGLGGTCWGHVAGLAGVLGVAGVDVTVALDRMLRDDAIDFHAFLVLRDHRTPLALDLVHPSLHPLPVIDGAVGSHPVYETGFTADESRLRHWFTHPDSFGSGTYNLLSTDLDADDVAAYCAVSARFSGVRARSFFSKRVTPDAILKAKPSEDGSSLVLRRWTVEGVELETIISDDPDEVFAALGYGPAVRRMAEKGGLAGFRDGRVWFTPPS